MKKTKPIHKPIHPADARRLSLAPLTFDEAISAVLKIKPEPKKAAKRRKRR